MTPQLSFDYALARLPAVALAWHLVPRRRRAAARSAAEPAQTGTDQRQGDRRATALRSPAPRCFPGTPAHRHRPARTGSTCSPGARRNAQTVRARMLGFRPDSASVTVAPEQRPRQDFTLSADPLQLQTLVVTGTQTPRMNLDASVAVTSLTAQDIQRAVPRSTTEVLRYVPGFTRVESSGGEVNENITMRGILGVEYVKFLEDGLPVFPTMHTFFMNADNLFRIDENIERMEVVRGGASAALRVQHAGRDRQLHQQDRRGRVRRYHARHGRHRGARPLRPQRQWAARATTGGSTWVASTATTTACATPAFPASGAARSRPASPDCCQQRVHPPVSQGHRRPQPVHSRPAVH